MSTLLLIHTYPGANETFARHWDYFYRRCGAAHVIGIGTTDGGCKFPDGCASYNIGRNEYAGRGLIERLVQTFHLASTAGYTDVCVIEYDTILAPLEPHPGGFVTHIAGHQSQGFKSRDYYHTPWWADRQTAARIADCGTRMLREGDIERGFPDRFLGWMFERFGLGPIVPAKAYSQNSLDRPEFIEGARQALTNGARFVHGVKTFDQLRAITKDISTDY